MPSFQVNPEYAGISEVVPGLYISGVSALNQETLSKHSISFIINATCEVPNNLRCVAPQVHRHKLWLEDIDTANIYSHFDPIADQIEMVVTHEKGSVLVHCVAGVSRSASLCLAYLTKYRTRSLRDAYHHLAKRRMLVRPNLGFWRQLIKFEQNIRGRSTVRLIQDGAQSERLLPDVYLKLAVTDSKYSDQAADDNIYVKDGRQRQNSGPKIKFVPVLEPLNEACEAAA